MLLGLVVSAVCCQSLIVLAVCCGGLVVSAVHCVGLVVLAVCSVVLLLVCFSAGCCQGVVILLQDFSSSVGTQRLYITHSIIALDFISVIESH